MKSLLFSVLTLFSLASVYSQISAVDSNAYPFWIEMMQDENVNFFEVQRAYNKYIEGKEESTVEGWKMYRRWEYQTSFRVDQNGKRPKASHNLLEYEKYYASRGKAGVLRDSDHWKE